MSSQAKAHGNGMVEHYLLRLENWYSPCIYSIRILLVYILYSLLHALGFGFAPNPCYPLIWIPGSEFHSWFNPFVFVHWALLLGLRFQGQKKDFGLGAADRSTFLLRFLMLLECKCLWEGAPTLPVTWSKGYMSGCHRSCDLRQVTSVFLLSVFHRIGREFTIIVSSYWWRFHKD